MRPSRTTTVPRSMTLPVPSITRPPTKAVTWASAWMGVSNTATSVHPPRYVRMRESLPDRCGSRSRGASYGIGEETAFRRVALHVLLHANLPSGVLRRHVAHGPENRPLGKPRPVVTAEHPEDARVRGRVPPVQRVLVVQLDHHRERLVRRRGPLQDLLP